MTWLHTEWLFLSHLITAPIQCWRKSTKAVETSSCVCYWLSKNCSCLGEGASKWWDCSYSWRLVGTSGHGEFGRKDAPSRWPRASPRLSAVPTVNTASFVGGWILAPPWQAVWLETLCLFKSLCLSILTCKMGDHEDWCNEMSECPEYNISSYYYCLSSLLTPTKPLSLSSSL